MKKPNKSKVRDLRNNQPVLAANPKFAREQEELKPLVKVDEPHLVTPGIGDEPTGQTTHE